VREPFFYAPTLADGPRLTVSGDEAHHAAAVQRLRVGDSLALFDGHGHVVRGRLLAVRARSREIDVEVLERLSLPPPQPRTLLYAALPKGDRMSVLLDMGTQLGMSRFTPLLCARATVEPRPAAPERWSRICLETCKQSRRAHLPELAPPLDISTAAERAAAQGARLLVAHPDANARPPHARATGAHAIFIGPEGGFTDGEIEYLRTRGAEIVTLGPRVLRIETAAVALLAALTLSAG
jgi:16S rRNA (uracil1498-N3)-methyltransferase